MLKLYSELAAWWPLLSPPEEYADESQFFWRVLSDVGLPTTPSLLELGCGGGSNAYHLQKYFAHVMLTDLSPGMLAVSRALNPCCEHLEGDMRNLRLQRVFDAVFVHDAIDYMTTSHDLRQVMVTARTHCKENGVALFVPDHVQETFQPSTDHGGRDGNGRALRYLEWSSDPDKNDTTYITEYAYVIREADRPMRIEHERYIHDCSHAPSGCGCCPTSGLTPKSFATTTSVTCSWRVPKYIAREQLVNLSGHLHR